MFQNFDIVVKQLSKGFGWTLGVTAAAFILALIIGAVLAIMRISPAAPARAAATVYTQAFRNVPLIAVLLISYFGLTEIGIGKGLPAWLWATIGCGMYTAAFVGETLRSGINSIPIGQAEAARTLGLTFGQSLRFVILPQSFRAVVPPLGSLLTALVKNSALASAIGVTELSAQAAFLIDHESGRVSIWASILGVALAYLIINLPISYFIRLAEQRAAITR